MLHVKNTTPLRKSKVVINATPFCFGPISTSLAIAEILREQKLSLVWLATGTALELLKTGNYIDEIVHFDIGKEKDRLTYEQVVREADAVIVNTDPEFAEWATKLNKKVIYIDILYWMWDRLPDTVSQCAYYIYEDFVQTKEQQERLGVPKNGIRVGPLIRSTLNSNFSKKPQLTRSLLVSFGGLYRTDNESKKFLASYKQMVTQVVLDCLEQVDAFSTVYIAGGGISKKRFVLQNKLQVQMGCLPKEVYDDILSNATAAILCPGLTGFYEAAFLNIPTFFLPPHNYSQYLQLQSFMNWLPNNTYSDWTKLGISINLEKFLPENDALKRVNSVLEEVSKRGQILKLHIKEFLEGGYNIYQRDKLKMYLDTLSQSGPETTAKLILGLIDGSAQTDTHIAQPQDEEKP